MMILKVKIKIINIKKQDEITMYNYFGMNNGEYQMDWIEEVQRDPLIRDTIYLKSFANRSAVSSFRSHPVRPGTLYKITGYRLTLALFSK